MYVRIIYADHNLLIIIAIIGSFFLSTLSEEIMKMEVKMLPTLYTLPVTFKHCFPLSILATAVTSYIPTFLAHIVLLSCLGLHVVSFIVSLSGSFVIGLTMCALQCTISCDGFISGNTPVVLLVSIILALFFPPYLFIYLIIRYNHVQKKFSGGRE